MGTREESLVYPITSNLGPVSALSTFDFRLELESNVSPGARVCLQGEFTPAMADTTSKALTWVTRALLISVVDGIYSINGTFGGTTGLEHMHQIVGAPKTADTWLNMVVAILVVSCAAALFLELLSAAEFLPAYNTASATLLIISTILAFVWLFRRMPPQRAGLLIFDTPKWYQQQYGHTAQPGDPRAEKMFVTTIVVMTFVRGAAIGGLQISGPVQLSILAASELFFLILIRWLRIYPIFSMGTFAPAVRLAATLLMIIFVRGASSLSARSAVGYAIISLHALMVVLGFIVPAIYQLSKICFRMFQDRRLAREYCATGSAGAAPIVPLSVLPQRSDRRDDRKTETSSLSQNILSPSNSQNNSEGTRPKQHEYQGLKTSDSVSDYIISSVGERQYRRQPFVLSWR
ncbi:hypothetical protein WHR41_03680 [Cladosporium halotolerans]|uniref:TRP C-terminal domain-containing protein n=1 Tax=Cladosporium halotolerans TaxID=1052096 RepID=A0AB34KSK1_9PEZI